MLRTPRIKTSRYAFGAALLRLIAVVSLLTFGGQTLLPSLHHLVAPHRVCPEHGDLIEAGDVAKDSDDGSERALARSYLPSDSEGHEHGHCGLWLGSRSEHAGPAAVGVVFVSSFASQESAPQAVLTASGLERYRIAPKQGPPRSA